MENAKDVNIKCSAKNKLKPKNNQFSIFHDILNIQQS